MKHIKKFNESVRASDYITFKIRYYADGINVRLGKFQGDNKQHHERGAEYIRFFWEMVEKVTGHAMKYWYNKYLSMTMDCIKEELHEKYGIIIPEGEEHYLWYIPINMVDLINWIEMNCKLPFKKLVRPPMTNIRNREVTTWRREESEKFKNEMKLKHPGLYE